MTLDDRISDVEEDDMAITSTHKKLNEEQKNAGGMKSGSKAKNDFKGMGMIKSSSTSDQKDKSTGGATES